MTELEQVTKERNLVLARMHAAPKENTGAWWRRECPDWCDACKLVELNKQVERLVREDERRLTVEACAQQDCPRCKAGIPVENNEYHRYEGGLTRPCHAKHLRALLP